jgi:anti-sigma28 factor (negative regulator of flagellin synthesis)
MHRDMAQRMTLARVDDLKRRNRIEAAREAIYNKNYAVDSAPVEKLLQEESLVPTAVCPIACCICNHTS